MNMNLSELENLQRSRREDMLRTAQREQLAREAAPEKTPPFYAASLAKVGDLLVAVGTDLQHRYGELVEEVHNLSLESPYRDIPNVTK